MYDLRVPVESYEREIDRLKTAAANAAKDTSQGTKGKKEQERFNTLIDKLQVGCRVDKKNLKYIISYCEIKGNLLLAVLFIMWKYWLSRIGYVNIFIFYLRNLPALA